MAGIDDVLDLTQAAQIANVTPARLRQLIEAGQLRGKKIGNSWAILADDLDALLGRSRTPGRPSERAALESRLRVELRPISPIHITLVGPAAEVRLWFRIDNRSNYEVELDRLLVDVWYPHPVAQGADLHRHTIPPNESIESSLFQSRLHQTEIEMMRQAATDRTQYAELQIYADAYFNTPIGTAHVATRITKQKGEFPIDLPPEIPPVDHLKSKQIPG
jgi:hypothetical protein